MTIVQLSSVLTLKLVGYFLGIFFAARALNRLNNLNIDIGGRPIRLNIYSFLIPLVIILISLIFDILYGLYEIHTFQYVSMILEGLSGVFFALAFLKLYEKLQKD